MVGLVSQEVTYGCQKIGERVMIQKIKPLSNLKIN